MGLEFQNKKTKQYEIPPEGGAVGRLYQIIDLGTQVTSYMGETKLVPQVMLKFELPNELTTDGQPMSINAIYTRSMNEKAKLRSIAKVLMGRKIEDKDVQSFSLSELLGKVATVDIVNKVGKDGTKKAFVQGIGAVPKGLPVAEPHNPQAVFNLSKFDQAFFDTLPKYLQDKIRTTSEYQSLGLESRVDATQGVPF